MRSSHVWSALFEVPKLISWFQHQASRRAGTRCRHHFVFLILVSIVLLLLPSLLFAESPEYRVIEIPVPSWSGCLSDDNSVVAGTTPDYRAWTWKDGVITYLPTGGSIYKSSVMAVNNSSTSVGWVSDSLSSWGINACMWQNGTLRILDGGTCCVPLWVMDINTSGMMIGKIQDTSEGVENYPFIYSGSGLVSALRDPAYLQFHAINDANAVAARSWSFLDESWRASVYHDGTVSILGGPNSSAYDINNSNHVLGEDGSGGFCLWKDGTQIPVGLRRTSGEYATGGLNDFDVVVGYTSTDGHNHAAVWQDGITSDLNTLIDPALGIHLYYGIDINNKGEILCNGTGGFWYLLVPNTPAITIRDAKNDAIPNMEFNLVKVTNDPPIFTEDTLGSFTTDDEGRLELTETAEHEFSVDLSTGTKYLMVGDSLKIAKHVYSMPAAKHPIMLGTMYSVHLDNAHFAEDGQMHFDTLKGDGFEVVLNHTELRYNLLASVQWEATDSYLNSLEDNFRFMSNYLYDVTDGQLRLDTVYIFDNNVLPDQADVLIRANNLEWPRATVGGIIEYGVGHIYMPRMFLGDSTSMRNYTDKTYPLNLIAYSTDYRTKTHEFGHYALGFWDEYMFHGVIPFLYSADDALRCLPMTIFNYGFMDHQYESAGKMSSEMSGAFRYDMESCRNTKQWGVYGMSCWDHLERWVEAVLWGADNLYVPILKPDPADEHERVVTNPAVFFEGPNDNMGHLDYHVGYLMAFPNAPSPQATGYFDKHVTVSHETGGDNAAVQLINDPGTSTETIINQGRTSDAAGAWVLGVKNASYRILAGKGGSGATVTPSPITVSPEEVTTDWLYGMAESGGSGVSKVGNRYDANSTGDSITIEMKKVQGYYPLICSAELLATGVKYDLTSVQPFSVDPSMQLWPSYGGSYDHAFTSSTNGYEAVVADSLGTGGFFTLWAVDDSAATFFVPTGYVTPDINHSQPLIWLMGQEGQSEFKLDSTNESLERALILSSPYPVVRTGLDENAVQAGQAHSLSVYPDDPLAGTNQVIIRYDDADLKLGDSLLGDASALAVYHWADASTGWEMIGGTVDTADDAIYAPISETGVYAAFTTNIITDVEQDERGDILPYQFELSQNYPNPFNPATTIEYSVPSRTDVTIEIFNVLGQKVRTLVDETKAAGSCRIEWNGNDDAGKAVSTGVYLYRFHAGDVVQTKKMLLLK